VIWGGATRRLLVVAALFGVPCGGVACGGADYVVPTPELSGSLTAQRDLQKLRDVWENGTRHERLDLERALGAHVRRSPSDPSSRTALAMLAIIAVEKDQPARAKKIATPLATGPDGTTKDAATVVLGAVERREGDPGKALTTLAPLFNKVVDSPTRGILNRELLLAAVGAKRFDHAALYLEAFVQQADPLDRAARRDEAHTLVQTFPKAPLVMLLEREQSATTPDRFLLGVVVDRLATLTIDSGDVALARRLLQTAGPLLGDHTDPVARVAARGATVRLERNTVGLLVPLGTPTLRRRGLDVAAGLSLALGLPGGKTRLVTRDDGGEPGNTEDALSLLNADGAAVVVAGFDRDGADAAVGFSDRTGLPVVLLRPPERPIPKDARVFVLGVDPESPREALVRALVDAKRGPIAMLVSDRDVDVPTLGGRDGVVAVQPCDAPVDFLRAAGAKTLLIDGPPSCARDALEAPLSRVTLAFGLDVGPRTEAGFYATAGLYPMGPARSDDALLEAFRAKGRGDPSFWLGLGHDAGLLVQDAVASLPGDDDADDTSASKRKDLVARAIEHATGRLWTTAAPGFGGARAISRTVGVVSRPKAR